MSFDYTRFMLKAVDFIYHVSDKTKALGLLTDQMEMDHICYRVETGAEYERMCASLSSYGVCLIEAMVGGRRISTFKLYEPIKIHNRSVDLIELPEPKEGSPYATGFEHAEFVISCTFDQLMNEHPELHFDLEGINKSVNADIKLKLDTFSSVKFHGQSLEAVIKLELEEIDMILQNKK